MLVREAWWHAAASDSTLSAGRVCAHVMCQWDDVFEEGDGLPMKLEICSGNGDWVAAQVRPPQQSVRV